MAKRETSRVYIKLCHRAALRRRSRKLSCLYLSRSLPVPGEIRGWFSRGVGQSPGTGTQRRRRRRSPLANFPLRAFYRAAIFSICRVSVYYTVSSARAAWNFPLAVPLFISTGAYTLLNRLPFLLRQWQPADDDELPRDWKFFGRWNAAFGKWKHFAWLARGFISNAVAFHWKIIR